MQNPQPGVVQGVNLMQNPQPAMAEGVNLMQNPQPGMAQNPQPGMAQGVNFMQNPQPGMAQGVNLMQNPQPAMAQGVNLMQNPQPGILQRVNLIHNPPPAMPQGVQLIHNPQPAMPEGVQLNHNPPPAMPQGVQLNHNPQPGMPQGFHLMQNAQPGMPRDVNFNPNLNMCRVCGFTMGINNACGICINYTFNRANELKRDIETQKRNNASQLEALQNSKDDVEFLRKWDFTPGEASPITDVTILCTSDGTLLHAHSRVLSSRSDVLRALLEGNERKELQIDGAAGNSVKAFVKFLYTAELSKQDMRSRSIKELVKLAHFYGVKHLTNTLDEYLSKVRVIGRNGIIETIKLAYLHGLNKTKKRVLRIMAGSDKDNELFNKAVDELYEVNTRMAHEFSTDVVNLY